MSTSDALGPSELGYSFVSLGDYLFRYTFPGIDFPYNFEKKFLSRVDLTKGPIMVSVDIIIRTMGIDWESPKRLRKEWLVFNTNWDAKDHRNNTIRASHMEGKHIFSTRLGLMSYCGIILN